MAVAAKISTLFKSWTKLRYEESPENLEQTLFNLTVTDLMEVHIKS